MIAEAALEALQAGLSPIPIAPDGSKKPAGSWKRFMTEAASEALVRTWFEADGDRGLAIVCGYGNVECLDFDDRATFDAFRERAAKWGIGELLARIADGYCEHSPNGAHLFYRCSEIAGNTKLARKPKAPGQAAKALIETRGERGYVITAPSGGKVHESGKPYVLERGGFGSIVEILPEERAELWALARSFDEETKARAVTQARRAEMRVAQKGDRPGDEFNARASWEEILVGWRFLYTDASGESYWCRPGKKRGVSATTNYAGSGLLYVFSTSTDFEAGRGYSKFSAFALLEHGDDYKAAAKALQERGYGARTSKPVPVDLSKIRVAKSEKKAPSSTSFPEELFDVPGMVGVMLRWIRETSVKSQPILALGAVLAALGTAVGQRARTEDDVRSNLYVIGLAASGMGKDRARKAMIELFDRAGIREATIPYQGMASDAGLRNSLSDYPVQLIATDELGKML
ncbi:MAG: bifunctional DNA primase/polymerase, partial [Myxococcota bacterium]